MSNVVDDIISIVRNNDLVALNQVVVAGDQNYKNKALRCACHYGKTECATLCLQCGADINCLDTSKETPLMKAVGGNHLSCIKMLLAYGCEIDAQNEEGDTALYIALFTKSLDINVIKTLLDHKADPHLVNNYGRSFHMRAEQIGQQDVLDLMVALQESEILSQHAGDGQNNESQALLL